MTTKTITGNVGALESPGGTAGHIVTNKVNISGRSGGDLQLDGYSHTTVTLKPGSEWGGGFSSAQEGAVTQIKGSGTWDLGGNASSITAARSGCQLTGPAQSGISAKCHSCTGLRYRQACL
jgi:hypothetical protein